MSHSSVQDKTKWLKDQALALGFMSVGCSEAQFLKEEAERLKNWLSQGFQGEMSYLENHFDKRTDPAKLVEGCQSVVTLSYNYFPETTQAEAKHTIAKYAYGRDYHKVIKKKLKFLWKSMEAKFENLEGRYFVDSGPVMEREWALRGGLGWVGKNTLIIDPKRGSYFFLAVILINQELEYDQAIEDHCGTCTRCIEVCPTAAIQPEGYVLEADKCISYLTIEYKEDSLPAKFEGKMDNWIFGCDLCQDVCPWNKFSQAHQEPEFINKRNLLTMTDQDWINLAEEDFNILFEGSAVKRTGYHGLKRNIDFVNRNGRQ